MNKPDPHYEEHSCDKCGATVHIRKFLVNGHNANFTEEQIAAKVDTIDMTIPQIITSNIVKISYIIDRAGIFCPACKSSLLDSIDILLSCGRYVKAPQKLEAKK